MSATFGVCFKFLTLLVFEISGTQNSGYLRDIKNFVCLNKIPGDGSGTVWSGQFIVLNDEASPNMTMKISFNFFRLFFKGFRAVCMSSRQPIYDC